MRRCVHKEGLQLWVLGMLLGCLPCIGKLHKYGLMLILSSQHEEPFATAIFRDLWATVSYMRSENLTRGRELVIKRVLPIGGVP